MPEQISDAVEVGVEKHTENQSAESSTAPKKTAAVLTAAITIAALSGCAPNPDSKFSMPADADGTFDRAHNGKLVVGISENQPYTKVDGDYSAPQVSGSEVDLIKGFAQKINAEIEWEAGSESTLAEQMKNGKVDIFIGGLTKDSPWTSEVSLTRSYAKATDEEGKEKKLVMAVPLGENELQVNLEHYLAEQSGELR